MAASFILKRGLSTSAALNQLVKTPIQVFGIDGRYATALYSAASKSNKLDAVDKEIQSVKDLYKTDAKFREFILDPSLQRATKKDALAAISKKLGLSDISTNFMGIVTENGRVSLLEGIISSFNQLMSAHRGEVVCQVVTAKPMDAALTKEVDTILQSFVKPGQKLLVTQKVDASIVGGMIVTVGDRYVDMSLQSKFQQYCNVLKDAI